MRAWMRFVYWRMLCWIAGLTEQPDWLTQSEPQEPDVWAPVETIKIYLDDGERPV